MQNKDYRGRRSLNIDANLVIICEALYKGSDLLVSLNCQMRFEAFDFKCMPFKHML